MACSKSNKSHHGITALQETKKMVVLKENTNLKNIDAQPKAFIVIPPDGNWGWIIVIATFFINLINDGIIYTFGLFLNDISGTLQSSATRVVLANSLQTGLFFLSGPITSAFINRFGFRKVALAGGILTCISLYATSRCSTLTSLILWYGVLGGIGLGMTFLSSIIVVSFYFEKWRALAQSITSCGSSMGITCFPLIFTTLLNHQNWRLKFKILACCALFCSLCALFFRPLPLVQVLEEPKALETIHEMADECNDGNDISCTNSECQNISVSSSFHGREVSSTSVFVESVSLANIESAVTIKSQTKSKTSTLSKIKGSVDKLLTVYEEEEANLSTQEKCYIHYSHWCCFHKKQSSVAVRPLNRDDIFYTASLAALPEYVKSSQIFQDNLSLGYHLSVTRVTAKDGGRKRLKRCACIPVSLSKMLDCGVLKSPSFLLLSTSGLFTVLGLYTPFMFLTERAVANGIDRKLAYLLITMIGVANTCGRITSGLLSSLFLINSLFISCVSLGVTGLVLLAFSMTYSICWQFLLAAIYGISIGCVTALRPIILVEMVGLQKLTNSFGITLVFQGIACLLGIPLSGYLKTVTNSYNPSFYFSGIVTLISALTLIPIKSIHNWEKSKKAVVT